jgi:hypothetical protein
VLLHPIVLELLKQLSMNNYCSRNYDQLVKKMLKVDQNGQRVTVSAEHNICIGLSWSKPHFRSE